MLEPAELRALAAVDPGLGAASSTVFGCAGMRSILRFSLGTQKLWMTSAVLPTTRTRTPAGMWMSFAVTAGVPSYRASQNHWWPTMWIVRSVELGAGPPSS